MSPQRSDFVLSTNIPHIELDVLICDCLDVETHCRDSCDILVQLQFVQNSCLSGSIQPEHQQAHFLRSEDLPHHLGDLSAHCDDFECEGLLEYRGLLEEGAAATWSNWLKSMSVNFHYPDLRLRLRSVRYLMPFVQCLCLPGSTMSVSSSSQGQAETSFPSQNRGRV
jgi:hypothetical protein